LLDWHLSHKLAASWHYVIYAGPPSIYLGLFLDNQQYMLKLLCVAIALQQIGMAPNGIVD
jgi:hypothetical protein